MKRFNRFLTGMTVMSLFLGLMGGCGSALNSYPQSSADSYEAEEYMREESYLSFATNSAPEYPQEAADVSEGSGNSGTENVPDRSRKLITTVRITAETQEFDTAMVSLETSVSDLGGYIENQETYYGSRFSSAVSTRYANMTLRIPKDRLEEFLSHLSGMANVVNMNRSVEDVTLSYVDIESRKLSLETEQTRLLELMEKAENIEDIITIEERLSSVRYQIESLGSQLRTYDNRVDYSTVSLSMEEVQTLTPIVEETVWQRISSGFVSSLKTVGNSLKEIFIWVVVNLPHLIIWGVIIFALIIFIRRAGKKKAIKAGRKIEAGKAAPDQAAAAKAAPDQAAAAKSQAEAEKAADRVEVYNEEKK